MNSQDLKDAFDLVLFIADEEDLSEDYKELLINNWNRSLKSAREEGISLNLAMTIRRSDHGRKVDPKYKNNTIIVGKTQEGNLLCLDGNHRLRDHIKKQSKSIMALIIDISWLEDADGMEFDFP